MAYFGGKLQDGVYQAIINQIPRHDRYIEPFLGGGAIMLKKRPAKVNIGVEMDKQAISSFPKPENCQVFRQDAFQFLSTVGKDTYPGLTFIYCDPPYPFSTRGKTRYKYELADEQHIELLELLKSLDCFVAISTYSNEIYADLLSDWRVVGYESVKRSGEVGKELLYMNYDLPKILHDDSYIGENANNRQDIKRRISRTKKRILSWNSQQRIKLLRTLLVDLPEIEKTHLLETATSKTPIPPAI